MNFGFKFIKGCFTVLRETNHRPAFLMAFNSEFKTKAKPIQLVRTIVMSKAFEQKSKKLRHKVDSDSDSDSDDEKDYLKEKGASEFWKVKMRTLHRILDVNKDGVVSFDDFKLLTERFTNLGHLSDEHREVFQKKIQEAWELQRGTVDPYNLVTTEQFLEDMHHILNDKALRKKVHRFLPFFFKAVDQDRDGEIAINEYKLFFECLGLTEADAVCSFRAIDLNNDGKLSLKEFVALGREYMLSQDPKTPSKFFWGPLADDHYHKT